VRVALHIDQLWFRAPGGIGTYVRNLTAHFGAASDDPEIVPFSAYWRRRRNPPDEAHREEGYRTPRINLPIQTLYPSWAYVRRPRLPRRFGHLDVIHATNHAAIPPARAGQGLVVTVHDLAFERFPELFPARWLRLYRRGLAIAVREADLILTPSAHTARDLEIHGVDRARVRVTPLAAPRLAAPPEAVIEDPLRSEELKAGAPFLLVVGTLEPRKNLPRLVRAFRAAVADAKLPHALLLAGPVGWHQESLVAELDDDPSGRIHRIGLVDPDELEVLHRDAAAVVYVSLYEGFGLPVLEALAHGVPTLASNTSSIPEVAGDAALLVDPEDEDAIAAGIVRILSDEPLRADLKAKGPVRAATFSWEATARATLAAYREVTGMNER
jgi:glycosyltransferase involved in cell wall biosynthesis